MKTKYLAIVPVFAAAFALTASMAFAGFDRHRSSDDVEVMNSNRANVVNNVEAESETGDNDVRARTARVFTGMADSLATSSTTANENRTAIESDCGCDLDDVKVSNRNSAYVRNNIEAESETGDNDVNSDDRNRNRRHHSHGGGLAYIDTGDAVSTAQAINLLNSNVTRISR